MSKVALIAVLVGSTVRLSDGGVLKVLENRPLKKPAKGVTHVARVKNTEGKIRSLRYNKRRQVTVVS